MGQKKLSEKKAKKRAKKKENILFNWKKRAVKKWQFLFYVIFILAAPC